MKSRSFWGVLALVVLLIAVVFAVASCFGIYRGAEIPGRIVAAFTSVAVTGVITWILLKGQRSEDERKDKNINIFQEKLKVYAEFNRELWKITDKASLKNLQDICMQRSILMLPYDKIGELYDKITRLRNDVESEMGNGIKAEITAILKDDITSDEAQLKEKRNQMKEKELQLKENEQQPKAQKRSKEDVNVEKIARLANAFGIEEDRANHAENQNVVSEAVQSEESKVETENHDIAVAFQDVKIQNIWQKYNEGKIQCWHFAALDNGKQAAALGRKPAVLSLIEYGEDWRTERLKQVQSEDVLFLFNRGGDGYVGMYEATGNFIIHNSAEGELSVFEDGREKEPDNDEIGLYDIYEAYEDDATYVSDVKVTEIKKLQGDTYNPINVVRQTIARLSPGNVQALLRYFDTAK